MEQNALTDPLTGVGNRRSLRQYFDRVLDGSTVSPRYLAMLDIDSFKPVSYTHLTSETGYAAKPMLKSSAIC